MPSYLRGGGSSANYAGPARGGSRKKKGRSVGGFIGNVAGDVGGAIMGLGPGAVTVGKAIGSDLEATLTQPFHPGRDLPKSQLAEKVGKPFIEPYKPLAEWDVRGFASNVYDHPLVLLDFVAGAGVFAGAVLRSGRVARATDTIRLETPAAKAGAEGGKVVERPTSTKPLRRGSQVARDRLLKLVPADTPVLGEFARAAREIDRLPRRDAQRLQLKIRPYQKAYLKLSEPEQVAAHLRSWELSPVQYKAHLLSERAAGRTVEEGTLLLLDDDKVRKAYENPSARVLDAVSKAREAGLVMEDVLGGKGRLGAAKAEQRRFLPLLLARGAKYENGELNVPDGLLDELKAEGHDPAYVPDVMQQEKAFIGRAGGGLGVPRSPVYKTEGVLFNTGRLMLGQDVLSPKFLATTRYTLHDDIHTGLMDSAIHVGHDDTLPAGYRYIRRPTGKSRQPEKIPHTQQALGEFRDTVEDRLRGIDEEGYKSFLADTKDAAAMSPDGKFYLAIPESFAKQASGEFLRSGQASRWLIEKPTAVWRALVLNLRPAWLVNNIVGNHLLYAMKYAGLDGLNAYVRAVRSAGKDSAEFRRLVEHHMPEQAIGTFLNTQSPTRLPLLGERGSRRLQNIASLGLRPLDIGVEQTLRRAAVETVLRKSPEVKTRMKKMWGETGRFEKAAREALEEHPNLARRVSDDVNSALGDFMNLSVFERQALRRIFPFYAWYKAILQITVKLPLDAPVRTALVAKAGLVGRDETEQALGDVPSYLKGAVLLERTSGDRQPIGNTTPLNPYATLPQLGQDISGTVNPVVELAGRSVFGEDRYTSVSPGDLLNNLLAGAKETGTNLPQARLLEALRGTIYKGTPAQPTLYDRRGRDELLRYLGVPYSAMSKKRARQLAEKERGGG